MEFEQGYRLVQVRLPREIRESVVARCWESVDEAVRTETRPGGVIFGEMRKHARFSEIEFIISIRSSLAQPDEDGIWHDDGSRVLAFSLSLTLDPTTIQGGKLELRRRGADPSSSRFVPTPPYGTMIVFETGHHGFEHKIHRVERGERIIIAGWCT